MSPGIRSPQSSENMLVDTSLQDMGTHAVHVTGAALPPPVSDHGQGYDCPLLPGPGEHSVGVVNQFSPHSPSFTTGSREVSSIGEWDASNITNSIPGNEDWLMTSNNRLPHAQSFYGNQNTGLEEFSLSTMDSMALNNAALDADISTYANSHAYDQTSLTDSIHGDRCDS